MKNLLMIYLLVISPQLTAQNSAAYLGDLSFNHFGSSTLDMQKWFPKNLIAVNRSMNDDNDEELLLDNFIHDRSLSTDGFSSFTLIEQLNELNRTTPLNVRHNATLERFIRVYLQDRRDYLSRLLGKSAYYFPVFEQFLDAEGLPLELKYLAVVESALNQVAVSSSGAKGLWQFMYGTGVEYDLYIDSFVDERFDLLKSTKAACAYLEKLYKMFGDWDLALAAYNSGPGNVKKAIERAGGNTNYWEIRKFLPRETSSYVPAFYATMYLFAYADYHQLNKVTDEMSFYETDTIQVKGPLSFQTISNNTGVETGLLRSLNPQYKQELIPGIKNKSLTLSLPINVISKYLSAEKDLYLNSLKTQNEKNPAGVITLTEKNSHLVSKGDNLNNIAKKYGISLEQLKAWNGLETNFLIAGQRLVVTDKAEVNKEVSGKNGKEEVGTQRSEGETTKFTTYTVQSGDTLFQISRKFGNIPIADLRSMNGLQDVHYLKPGMLLKIRKEMSGKVAQILSKS